MKYFKLLLFFLLLNLSSSEKKQDRGFIEWKPIQSANGYKIEIRDSLGKLNEFYSEINIFYPDLQKGRYEFRIAVLNLFKKPVVFSYWNPLKVIQSKQVVIKQTEFVLEKGKKVTLLGENFLENTKISFKKENKKEFLKTNLISDSKIEVMTENLEQGIYDLEFENPNSKISLYPKILKILSENEIAINEVESKREFVTVADTKDIKINSYSLNKADISLNSDNNKLVVNIGPKTTEKLDINLENKSKEKAIIDIENHSIGEIVLNVENKSKEELQMNVDSSSKEKMEIMVNGNSVGKVNLNLTEKAKRTVAIGNSNQVLEDFDITIENKQKDFLGIKIGERPLQFTGSNEVFPANFILMSEGEVKNFISNLSRNCPSNLDMPNILIKDCFEDHATLNLTEQNHKILFYYLILGSDNYDSKMKSMRYFKNYCSPSPRFVNENLESKISSNSMSSEETIFAKDTLNELKNCRILDRP